MANSQDLKELVCSELRKNDFKPLPVNSIGKNFDGRRAELKRIMASSLSDILDDKGYLITPDVREAIWDSFYDDFIGSTETITPITSERGRTKQYLDWSVLRDAGIRQFYLDKAIINAHDFPIDTIINGVRGSIGILYKDLEKLNVALREDYGFSRIKAVTYFLNDDMIVRKSSEKN